MTDIIITTAEALKQWSSQIFLLTKLIWLLSLCILQKIDLFYIFKLLKLEIGYSSIEENSGHNLLSVLPKKASQSVLLVTCFAVLFPSSSAIFCHRRDSTSSGGYFKSNCSSFFYITREKKYILSSRGMNCQYLPTCDSEYAWILLQNLLLFSCMLP